MTLTPEQKQSVAEWVAAGDNLSAVQKKLTERYKLSLTYMDVRFLVDDLNLSVKDRAPKADASDLKAGPAKADPPAAPAPEDELPAEDEDVPPEAFDEPPVGGSGSVTVAVDKVTLHPGAVASGTVTFSDGVTGKWIVDNYGRPGFTEVSRKDYRPSPADAQAFMQELGAALQQRGF